MSDLIISFAISADTPIGRLSLAAHDHGLVAVAFGDDLDLLEDSVRRSFSDDTVVRRGISPLIQTACEQLEEFIAGRRKQFELPLDLSTLTPFQAKVLPIVSAIPYGQWRTYRDVATELERPGASRAVGRANATNPMPIIIPCHRVLGSDGRLHGYGGGVERKAFLLRLEGSRLF